MIQQRPIIDPDSILLQHIIDCIDILEHIIGRIQKKTRDNSLELPRHGLIDLSELPSSHREICILRHNLCGQLVRHFYTPKHVLFGFVVVQGMDERVDFVLLFFLSGV